LIRRTGLPSGTVYLMLARMEAAGLLTSGKEDIDPRVEGRPPRRHYTITGALAAHIALVNRLSSVTVAMDTVSASRAALAAEICGMRETLDGAEHMVAYWSAEGHAQGLLHAQLTRETHKERLAALEMALDQADAELCTLTAIRAENLTRLDAA
jgi:PadR family transcriptional regulator, regulatory protein PadR